MSKIAILIAAILVSTSINASTTYYSDGTTSTTLGDTTYFSDGTTATQLGETVYFSNGETATTLQ